MFCVTPYFHIHVFTGPTVEHLPHMYTNLDANNTVEKKTNNPCLSSGVSVIIGEEKKHE